MDPNFFPADCAEEKLWRLVILISSLFLRILLGFSEQVVDGSRKIVQLLILNFLFTALS